MAQRTQGASGSGNLTSALDQALGEGDAGDFLSGEVTIDQIHKLSSEHRAVAGIGRIGCQERHEKHECCNELHDSLLLSIWLPCS